MRFLEELFDFLAVMVSVVMKLALDVVSFPVVPVVYVLDMLFERKSRKEFKSILITGASSGIGEGMALCFAKPGVKLVLTGRNEERLDSVARECMGKGASVSTHVVDVVDKAAMERIIDSEDADRPLDLVIANAGISYVVVDTNGSIRETIYKVSQTNIDGVLNTVMPAAEKMSARKYGQIAMLGSVGSWVSYGEHSDYHMTKYAVRGLAEGLRPLLVPFNVGVSVICPGFVESRMIIPLKEKKIRLPLLMTAERAGEYIKSGLERNVGVISFPFFMFFLVTWLAGLPSVMRSFFQRYGATVAPFDSAVRVFGLKGASGKKQN